MCSLADCEMLVSHSPPVFSHSPPTAFLADYPALRFAADSAFRPPPQQPHRPPGRPGTLSLQMPASPIRPCLVVRADEPQQPPQHQHQQHQPDHQQSPGTEGAEDPVSPTRLKKRVVFADARGIPLTEVRVMREPSGVPPLWSLKFLAEVTGGQVADPAGSEENWEICFAQPASNYVEFRKRLDTNKVSLENVIVKESEDLIVGTVKVSNLDFNKEVVVRVSWDGWRSHDDVPCSYVPQSLQTLSTAAYVLYDTFSFKLPIPLSATRAEFCVCFRCQSVEHWDNGGGVNYVLAKRTAPAPPPGEREGGQEAAAAAAAGGRRAQADVRRALRQMYTDAADGAKLNSWSEFASWTHLENSRPHW